MNCAEISMTNKNRKMGREWEQIWHTSCEEINMTK
jgi:hypothetical protein